MLVDRAARVKACGRKGQEARRLEQREQMGGPWERRLENYREEVTGHWFT